MFLTKNYICFYSKILSAENILLIKLQHINTIKKTMHALIFPTAIRIETKNSNYQFTSFRSRSNTLDHLTKLLSSYNENTASDINQSNGNPVIGSSEAELLSKSDENVSTSRDVGELSIASTSTDLGSEEDEGESNLTRELLAITDEESSQQVDANNNCMQQNANDCNTPVLVSNKLQVALTSGYKYYDLDCDLSNRKATLSPRLKQSLIQKVKVLIGLLIPAFFE